MELISYWRRHRQQRGLRLVDAAAQLGISAGALSMIERGIRRASLDTIERGCRVYSCQPSDLYRFLAADKIVQ